MNIRESVTLGRTYLDQALWALRENRLRTVMSVMGIALGIAAMMIVSIIAESGREYIFSEFKTYGLKSVWIYRNWDEKNPNATVRQGSGIDNQDLNAIKGSCCPDIVYVSPSVYPENWIITVNAANNFTKSAVEGVGVDFLRINNDDLILGRNFRRVDIRDRRPVALVGVKTAEELFGKHQSPLGRTVRMGDQALTVIGVLQPKNREFLTAIGANDYDVNNRVLIPYTLYQQILGSEDIHTLRAEATSLARVDAAIEQLRQVLERRNRGRYEYTAESMQGWIATAERILGSVSLIGLIAAGVALVVGGMGIMSIMSTSVVERTREIGLRKAVGARPQDILAQFLTESIFISAIGGAVGLLLGSVSTVALALWSGFPITPSWLQIAIALVVSVGVGIASGYYPAYRAAQLMPVEALRHE